MGENASKILEQLIIEIMGLIFPHKSKVIKVDIINHDVICLQITKPWGFEFEIGQAVDLSIDKEGYELAMAPFTIASVPNNDYLEFIIKVYPNKNSLTKGIADLLPNDTVQLTKAWDSYKYNGSGTFIAAGTGITPFLPIFIAIQEKGVDITNEHKLIYANKTKEDVLFYTELKQIFHSKLALILSRKKSKNFHFGKINKDFLEEFVKNKEQKFYVCGPIAFEEDVKMHLIEIGVNHNHIQTGYNS